METSRKRYGSASTLIFLLFSPSSHQFQWNLLTKGAEPLPLSLSCLFIEKQGEELAAQLAQASRWLKSEVTSSPKRAGCFMLKLLDGPCRNLPFGGRAMRDSRVRLPRKENARSHHQRLFEENVGKTRKVWSTNFKCERFRSCIYARGRYQHPTRLSQGTTTFNQVCKYDFNLFYFPFTFLCLFMPFFLYFLSFCSRQGVSLAPTYSSIVIRKSDLRSSLRTKRWLSCFYRFFLQDIL